MNPTTVFLTASGCDMTAAVHIESEAFAHLIFNNPEVGSQIAYDLTYHFHGASAEFVEECRYVSKRTALQLIRQRVKDRVKAFRERDRDGMTINKFHVPDLKTGKRISHGPLPNKYPRPTHSRLVADALNSAQDAYGRPRYHSQGDWPV